MAGKRGRPKKDAAEKRTRFVDVRLSDAELADLQARADQAGMTVAAYLRAAAFKAQVVNREDWRRRCFLLANVGNNLNQVARWANTYKDGADALSVCVALLRLERTVREAEGLEAGAEPEAEPCS